MKFMDLLEEVLTERGYPSYQKAADKRKTNSRDDFKKPGKYKIGDRVKKGSEPGELVKQDVTVNDGYRNPCYHIKCDSDGKVRKFQGLVKEETAE
jgi:hypothetical protein